ncbi:MAG: hypothetical protein ACXVXQ_11205 [Mycobacteriaceae bacterium]
MIPAPASDHQQDVGAFRAWAPHIERAAMGFHWLFVNPVKRPGASGSIHAIVNHFEANRALIRQPILGAGRIS